MPEFDKERLGRLPGAAIRYVLNDKRIDMLTVGMRLTSEIDENIMTLARDTTYTDEDRKLLKEYSKMAMASDAMKKMKIE